MDGLLLENADLVDLAVANEAEQEAGQLRGTGPQGARGKVKVAMMAQAAELPCPGPPDIGHGDQALAHLREPVTAAFHPQWSEDPLLAKLLEGYAGPGLGDKGNQRKGDIRVAALGSRRPFIEVLTPAVITPAGREVAGHRFGQRVREISVLHPGSFQHSPVIPQTGGMGQQLAKRDRDLRVAGVADWEG